MDKYYYMNYLRAIHAARPELFPLNADEIDAIETKALDEPQNMTDRELMLLAVSKAEMLLWEIYNEEDPDNGDDKFYIDLYND